LEVVVLVGSDEWFTAWMKVEAEINGLVIVDRVIGGALQPAS
jgi:hypothetical protein